MTTRRSSLTWAVLLGALFGLPSAGDSLPFAFTKIADTYTVIPKGTGNFTSFGGFSLDDRDVAFAASGLRQEGIYVRATGTLSKVADLNTAIPGGSGTFKSFGGPSLDDGTVAFKGSGSGQEGIYTYAGGTLKRVADLDTAIPGGSGTFTNFRFFVSLEDGTVAFRGSGSGQQGIYTSAQSMLRKVADRNITMPGGTGRFTFLGDPSLDRGAVAFVGERSASEEPFHGGIYTATRGTLTVLADLNTAVPGGSGSFTNFGASVSLDDGTVAFKAAGSGQQGIYTAGASRASVVVDLNTPVPGGSGSFAFFAERPSADAGNVAFRAVDSSGTTAIYATIGGSLTRVIASGDSLDGKSISFLGFDREALSGDSIAFSAVFRDGSRGIFVAAPAREPSTLVVFGSDCQELAVPLPISTAPWQQQPHSPR